MFTTEKSITILKSFIDGKKFPDMCVVLGSGWSDVLSSVKVLQEISYEDVFGVTSSVKGHDGRLILTDSTVFMAGRFHTYEGYTTEEVTRPIQVMASMGLKKMVITSAAGALNEKYRVGDFVILSDMITAFCQSPLVGHPTFIDLSEAFDRELRAKAIATCVQHKLSFHEGIYCYTKGPHFETPADKMLFHHAGADVIGMSTVPETIMARSLDIQVLGISYVTNLAFVKHEHADVLAAANTGSKNMVMLLNALLV